ncbi:hypothetical protein PCANB_000532 [Pneumocystis canis]|nr:hypothetical protein PCK1_000616 [Pneumocystis canis]KAG5437818.1 hypothetical protein PCANB_000532 [Pneumocystis canis]
MSQRVLRKRIKTTLIETPESVENQAENNSLKTSVKYQLKRHRTHEETNKDQSVDRVNQQKRVRTRSMDALPGDRNIINDLKSSDRKSLEKRTISQQKELLEEIITVEQSEKNSDKINNSSTLQKYDFSQNSGTQSISTINEQLEYILQRLNNNETLFKEQLHHLNELMELLKGKVLDEISNKDEPSQDIQRQSLYQKDTQLQEPLFRRDNEDGSPLESRYPGHFHHFPRNLNYDENDFCNSSSAMTLYKISQEMRSPVRSHPSRKRQKWTEDEVVALIDLVNIYGPSWAKIKKMDIHGWLQRRTQVDLKDKARIIKQHLLETPEIWNQFLRHCENWEAVSVGNSVGHRGVHSS